MAGDTPVLANWSSKKVSSTTETDTGLLITVTKAGTYRFKIPCYAGSSYSMSGGGTVYIYQNGVKVVTCTLSSSAINLLSEEIACDAGDTISVYAAGTSSRMEYEQRDCILRSCLCGMDKRILNIKCIDLEKEKMLYFILSEIQHFSLRPDKGRQDLAVKSGRG